jgi:hypothetical protein
MIEKEINGKIIFDFNVCGTCGKKYEMSDAKGEAVDTNFNDIISKALKRINLEDGFTGKQIIGKCDCGIVRETSISLKK